MPDAKAREAMIRSMLTPEMCAKVKYAGMLVVVCVCVRDDGGGGVCVCA